MPFSLFLTCRASDFLTFPVNPLQFRIQIVTPQTLLYFTFRSITDTTTVDIRAPASSLSLEFSLHLPQILCTSTSCLVVAINPPSALASVTTPPQPIADLSFKLGNISNDIFSAMDADQMRKLLIDARNTLSSTTSASSNFVQPSNLFTSPLPVSAPVSHQHNHNF